MRRWRDGRPRGGGRWPRRRPRRPSRGRGRGRRAGRPRSGRWRRAPRRWRGASMGGACTTARTGPRWRWRPWRPWGRSGRPPPPERAHPPGLGARQLWRGDRGLRVAGARRGAAARRTVAVLGDGAQWIWRRAGHRSGRDRGHRPRLRLPPGRRHRRRGRGHGGRQRLGRAAQGPPLPAGRRPRPGRPGRAEPSAAPVRWRPLRLHPVRRRP